MRAGRRYLLLLPSDPRQDAGFNGQCIALPVSESAVLTPTPAVPHTRVSWQPAWGGGSVRRAKGVEEADRKATICPIPTLKNLDLNTLLWLRAMWVQ